MNNYEEKKLAKIERYKELSEKAEQKSNSLYREAKSMASVIPFGQPILVGHHSEKSDRNYRGRINNKFEKSFEEQSKADYYKEKAKTVENNNSISSDDPEAVTKLKEKINSLEKNQQLMKDANKIIKNKKLSSEEKSKKLIELGFNYTQSYKLQSPDYAGRFGFPAYSLSNNNANIRSAKIRLANLERKANQETKEKIFGEIKLLDNVENNRLQIFFPDKPSEKIRTLLKRNGFRWSRFNGCWQSYRGHHYNQRAENIIKEYHEN